MPNSQFGHRKLSFQKLEEREVLSASLPVGTDLVENGDFESLDANFASDWSTQVSTHDFAGRAERGLVANVSDGTEISQTIDAVAGQKYILTFDYRIAGDASQVQPGTAQVDINGGARKVAAVGRWQTAATVMQADSTSLEIRLAATGGDVFVDCVRLIPVEDLILENGSFEELPNDTDAKFTSDDFLGWSSVGDRGLPRLNPMRGEGSDGNSSLNVDGNAELLDRVFQNIQSEAGQKQIVLFDVKGAEGGVGEENELRVRWNDGFIGAFDGTSEWQTFGFVADATSDLSRLLFREAGDPANTSNGSGPYIDNIRSFRVIPGSDSLEINEPDSQVREFVEDGGPVTLVSGGVSIGNSVDDRISGAVVKIQNMLDSVGNEILSVNVGNTSIQSSYDSAEGRLRIFGRGSLEDYETVLKSLTYNNLSQNPDTTARNIRITIDYSKAVSTPLFVDVNVSEVNDRPTMRPIQDQSVTVLTSFTTQVDASDIEDPGDLKYSVEVAGTAVGQNDAAPTISDSGLIEWIPQQSGTAEFTVTVEDSDGDVVRRSFTVNAVLDANVPSNFQPFSGARQLSNVVPGQRNGIYDAAPSMNIDLSKEYRAVITTDDGDIEILLYDNATPITVNSFVNLARDGYFDGLTFHRVQSLIGSLTDGFIAQAGDPLGTSGGGPGYNFADENLGNSIFNKPVIAMANQGVGTSTNGGQFFLTFDNQVSHLNGNHTIFGEITNGLEVVNSITKRVPNSGVPAEVIRKVTIIEN